MKYPFLPVHITIMLDSLPFSINSRSSARGRWVDGVPHVAREEERPPGRGQDSVRAQLLYDAAPTPLDDAPGQSHEAHEGVIVVGPLFLPGRSRSSSIEGRGQGSCDNCDLGIWELIIF